MKTVNIKVEDDLHRKMRLAAVKDDKTIKQYISDLIKTDVEAKKETAQ